MRTLLFTGAALLAAASPAAAAVTLGGPVIVPNGPSTGATGVTVALGTVSIADSFQFTATATPFLQPLATYGTNAAGVVTVPGSVGVGGSLVDGQSGFTYGALIASLIVNGVTQNTVQVFATNSANGLGSLTPPLALTYSGSIGSLFSYQPKGTNVNASINFRVDDSGYDDNSGGFVLAQTAVVPEPASWALMIAGFGLVGTAMRRRRVAVSFA